jgi:hypothetical protein
MSADQKQDCENCQDCQRSPRLKKPNLSPQRNADRRRLEKSHHGDTEARRRIGYMVEVMSEKSSPCNSKRCPTIQVANRSDAEESSRRSGSAAARETQLHILIATEVHQSGRDEESSKSGKSWRIMRTVPKKSFSVSLLV